MLHELKTLLDIAPEDSSLDQKLYILLAAAETRLRILLGGLPVPEELNYIVVEVAVIRFNRIGSEGFSSHTVEGESAAFLDNDFAGYMDEIEAWLSSQRQSAKGKVRFL